MDQESQALTANAGYLLLEKTVRTKEATEVEHEQEFSCVKLGTISQIKSGPSSAPTTTTLTSDNWDRVTKAEVQPIAGGPTHTVEHSWDQLENVAVTRTKNLDRDGHPPRYQDGTGGGRSPRSIAS